MTQDLQYCKYGGSDSGFQKCWMCVYYLDVCITNDSKSEEEKNWRPICPIDTRMGLVLIDLTGHP